MKTERVGYYCIFVVWFKIHFRNLTCINILLCTPALMVQSLLGNDKKPDVSDLAVVDGIKGMLGMHGFTRDKILNTMVSNLAETPPIDYYVALIGKKI